MSGRVDQPTQNRPTSRALETGNCAKVTVGIRCTEYGISYRNTIHGQEYSVPCLEALFLRSRIINRKEIKDSHYLQAHCDSQAQSFLHLSCSLLSYQITEYSFAYRSKSARHLSSTTSKSLTSFLLGISPLLPSIASFPFTKRYEFIGAPAHAPGYGAAIGAAPPEYGTIGTGAVVATATGRQCTLSAAPTTVVARTKQIAQ